MHPSSTNTLPAKVSAFIAKHQLLQPDNLYLVALSGGCDSVALLLIMKELGYKVEATHCNFMLRGEESMRDERFCHDLCQRLHIPFHTIHFDTRTYASLHKISIEMAARELRYTHFNKLCRDIGADGVCVAHHMDDSVETILLNLIRGTGLHGLTGIAPKRDIIIRPLLAVRRDELRKYLKEKNQDYVDDSSNFVPDVHRNLLRLKVFPLLKEINPAFVENIDRCAGFLQEVERVYDDTIDDMAAKAQLPNCDNFVVARIQKKAVQNEGVLFKLLAPYGFNPTQIENIFSHLSSSQKKRFLSPTHELLVDTEVMEVLLLDHNLPTPLKIPETGTYIICEAERIRLTVFDKPTDFSWSTSTHIVHLDAEKIRFPLTLRHVENGDRFRPFGMTGTKLLSDFLTDLKLSTAEKRHQWLLVDADDRILWVVNCRIDHRFRVTTDTTQILEIEFLAT
ncbi:MAG: tRNA lysidine(34) synthetase TilS [Prevotella sp.]|nr:tRNA lysidine(34) synthetase TilS [Prevotella sp.]